MATEPCKKEPKYFIAQLQTGSPTASTDCGVCSPMMAVSSCSCGWKNPNGKNGVANMRDRQGNPDGGTTIREMEQGIESYTSSQMGGVVSSLKANVKAPGTFSDLKEWLAGDRIAVLGVDYGKWNAQGLPTGDPNFTGWHATMFRGFRTNSNTGKNQTKVWDPLFDGRRSGIASGPTWCNFNDAKPAMTGYAKACGYSGDDIWYGLYAKPGERTVEEPDEPTDPCAQAQAELRIEVMTLRDLLLDHWSQAHDLGDHEMLERIRLALRPGEDTGIVVQSSLRTEPYTE